MKEPRTPRLRGTTADSASDSKNGVLYIEAQPVLDLLERAKDALDFAFTDALPLDEAIEALLSAHGRLGSGGSTDA